MSDDLVLRAIETRIDATLFGRRYWASPRWREIIRCRLYAVSKDKNDVPEDRAEITPAEAATCADIWCHREYCSDWSLIPQLLEACHQRGWDVSVYPLPWTGEDWTVDLGFRCVGGGRDAIGGKSKTWPEALCRAVVAVLDATEESAKVEGES